MLILVDSNGAAAVIFTEANREAYSKSSGRFYVKYRYRYESRDGKTKQSGTGEVYELYSKGPHDDGVTYIKAGPIKIEWSKHGPKHGWIYYSPEQLQVSIANSRRFETVRSTHRYLRKKLDLRRFMK